jgi:hypothetical protein
MAYTTHELEMLKETALSNFELLLNYWNLDYKRITSNEFDILAKWRNDQNFGGCRFNIFKGRGADWAGGRVSDEALAILGLDRSDISSYSDGQQGKVGFDIIGLVERVYNVQFTEATVKLRHDLDELSTNVHVIKATEASAKRRKDAIRELEEKKKQRAWHIWEDSGLRQLEGTPAHKYLLSRNITIMNEQEMHYHPKLWCDPARRYFPALLFPVRFGPTKPVIAVHRIYIDPETCTKAAIETPKMLLGKSKGAGIWFGDPDAVSLSIVEGPENALMLHQTYRRVADEPCLTVSTISTAFFDCITLPPNVIYVALYGDNDKAGNAATEKAEKAYRAQGRTVEKFYIGNAKYDINDIGAMHDRRK